jgi:hypothetical protein
LDVSSLPFEPNYARGTRATRAWHGATTAVKRTVMSFYTDMIQSDPRFTSAGRVSDLALLEPVTRAAVEQIVRAAAVQHLTLIPFETYRSQQRQQLLFDQGATKLRTVGVHHFGLACDLVKSIGGEPSWKGDFSFLKALAEQNGLIWAATGAMATSCTASSTPTTCSGSMSPINRGCSI